MEAWGGNGYVEEGPMPRLYRETPVNSIWEGSGNVIDVYKRQVVSRTQPDGDYNWAHGMVSHMAWICLLYTSRCV